MIRIYADGGYNPAQKQGGWGVILLNNQQREVFSGVVRDTTGNRMEITAALEGLRRTPAGAEATVYTDSQYLFGIMTQSWQRRANRDLLDQLDAVVKARKVRWEWLDPSQPNPYQKQAHALAFEAASEGKTEAMGAGGEAAAPAEPPSLTHVDEQGRPRMVDISDKPDTVREAIARGALKMQPATFQLIKQGRIAKGDVLTTAQLAGIMAAKQTPTLIPLCHPILISRVSVVLSLQEPDHVEIAATVRSTGKTGVEMEALTAVAVAALTVYDMCKAVDRGMTIESIRLVRKSGGKSGLIQLEAL